VDKWLDEFHRRAAMGCVRCGADLVMGEYGLECPKCGRVAKSQEKTYDELKAENEALKKALAMLTETEW